MVEPCNTKETDKSAQPTCRSTTLCIPIRNTPISISITSGQTPYIAPIYGTLPQRAVHMQYTSDSSASRYTVTRDTHYISRMYYRFGNSSGYTPIAIQPIIFFQHIFSIGVHEDCPMDSHSVSHRVSTRVDPTQLRR